MLTPQFQSQFCDLELIPLLEKLEANIIKAAINQALGLIFSQEKLTYATLMGNVILFSPNDFIMHTKSVFILLCACLMGLSACQTTRQLRYHRSELDRLAFQNLGPVEKFDGLANTLVTVLEEATDRPSPYKTFRYLEKFSQQNEPALLRLATDLDQWQGNMNSGERIKFTARVSTKAYARRLVFLIPKVTKMMQDGDYKLRTLEKVLILFRLKKMLRNKE